MRRVIIECVRKKRKGMCIGAWYGVWESGSIWRTWRRFSLWIWICELEASDPRRKSDGRPSDAMALYTHRTGEEEGSTTSQAVPAQAMNRYQLV